MKLQLKRIAL